MRLKVVMIFFTSTSFYNKLINNGLNIKETTKVWLLKRFSIKNCFDCCNTEGDECCVNKFGSVINFFCLRHFFFSAFKPVLFSKCKNAGSLLMDNE